MEIYTPQFTTLRCERITSAAEHHAHQFTGGRLRVTCLNCEHERKADGSNCPHCNVPMFLPRQLGKPLEARTSETAMEGHVCLSSGHCVELYFAAKYNDLEGSKGRVLVPIDGRGREPLTLLLNATDGVLTASEVAAIKTWAARRKAERDEFLAEVNANRSFPPVGG